MRCPIHTYRRLSRCGEESGHPICWIVELNGFGEESGHLICWIVKSTDSKWTRTPGTLVVESTGFGVESGHRICWIVELNGFRVESGCHDPVSRHGSRLTGHSFFLEQGLPLMVATYLPTSEAFNPNFVN